MSLSSLRKRIKGIASPITDPVASARDWLQANAPSLLTAAESGVGVGKDIALTVNPVTALPRTAYEVGQIATGNRDLTDIAPLRILHNTTQLGHSTVEEPIAYGINQRLGVEGSQGPFSGQERQALGQAAAGIENPIGRMAAQSGLFGLDIATDPTAYVPLGGLARTGRLGQIGATAAGFTGNVGGFGVAPVRVGGSATEILGSLARSVGQTALAGTALSAGSQVGQAAGERVGGAPGGLLGSLVGGGAAMVGLGHTGALGVSEQSALKKLQKRTAMAVADESALPASEREVLDLARGTSLHTVGARTVAAGIDDPNVQYEFRYRVVSLDDLRPSHTDTMQPTPGYPQEIQGRLRDRAGSQAQVDRIAANLAPGALLDDVRQLDRGPMIVGPDLAVESGNGRTIALRRARERYPEQFAAYEQTLRDRLPDYGLSEDAIRGIRDPVLVRERVTSVNRAAFADEANRSAGISMSALEQGRRDAALWTDDMVAGLSVSPNETIDAALLSSANRPLVQRFIAGVPANERAAMADAKGNLSRPGLDRVKRALFAQTFPGDAGERLARTFTDSLDSGVKNIETALWGTLPAMAKLRGLTETGQRAADLALGDDLAAAVDVLARLRQEQMPVGQYLAQSSMFGKDLTPFQEELLRFLDTNSRKTTQLRETFGAYTRLVEAQPPPNQGSLFGDVPRPSKGEVFDAAIRETGIAGIAEPGFGAIADIAPVSLRAGSAGAEPVASAATAARPELAGTGLAVDLTQGAPAPGTLPPVQPPAAPTGPDALIRQPPLISVPPQPVTTRTVYTQRPPSTRTAPTYPLPLPPTGGALPPVPPVATGATVPLPGGTPATWQPSQRLLQGAGILGGAAIGATQGDTVEERLRNAAIGAAVGGVGATVAAGRIAPPPKAVATLADDLTNTRTAIDEYLGHLATRDRGADTPQRLIADLGQVERASGNQASLAGTTARQLGALVEAAYARGDIVPTGPEGQAIAQRVQALLPSLPKPMRERALASGMPAEILLDDWEKGGAANFTVRAGAPPEVQQAVDALRNQWDALSQIETKYGVSHESMVENYQPRKWESKDGQPVQAAVARRPGATQGFQRQRAFESTLDGLEAGYTPAWHDIGDLFEYRVKAGAQAMAGQQVIQALKDTPGWVTFDNAIGTQGNYRKLDLPILKRAFPTYDTATIKGILADVEAGAKTNQQGMNAIREELGVATQTPWIRKDVARYLTAKYGTNPLADSNAAKYFAGFNSVTKNFKLGYDLAMAGRLGPMLGATMAGSGNPLNPVSWARATSAVYRAFETSVTRGATDEYFRQGDNAAWAYYLGIGRRGGGENPILGYTAGGGPLAKVPVLGKKTAGSIPGLEALEDWQFNHFVPVLQTETAKTLYNNLKGSGVFEGMNDPEIRQSVGRLVAKATGNVDLAALGRSPATQALERNLLLSPGWTEGYLGLALGTLKNNPDGALARRFWAGTTAMALAGAVGLSVAFTGDASPEHLKQLLDPNNPDSVTNPMGRGFLKVELPNGMRVDLWGPLTPVVRAVASIPAGAEQAAMRKAEQTDSISTIAAEGLRGAIGISPEKAGLNGIKNWINGRRSLPVGVAQDLIANRDFRGRAIATAESPEGQTKERLQYLGMQFVPMGTEAAGLTQEKSAVPELAFGNKQAAFRGIGNLLGLNVSTPARDPQAIQDKVTSFLDSQGQNGGLDPVGYLNGPKVDQQQRADFLAQNPDVVDYLRKKRQETALNISVPVGRDAARLYSNGRSQLQAQRDAAFRDAAAQLDANTMTGNDYRDAWGKAWDAYINGTKALAQSYFGLDPSSPTILDDAQQKINRIYGRGNDGTNDYDRIQANLNAIQPVDKTPAAEEAAMQARRDYITNLSPADRKTYEDRRLANARQNGGQTAVDYMHAQDVYSQYAAIPTYLGMTAEEGRAVSQALGRARDMQRLRPGVSTLTALLMDKSTPDDIKVRAFIASKGKLSNPARRQYYLQHAAEFGRFYSNVGTDTLAQFGMTG